MNVCKRMKYSNNFIKCRQKDKSLVRDAKVLRKIMKLETNIKKIAINRKHYEEKLRKKGQKNIQKRKEATLSKYKETSEGGEKEK